MELWNQLADSAPNINFPWILGFVAAVVVAAILTAVGLAQGEGFMAPVFGFFLGGILGMIVGVGANQVMLTTAHNDSVDAIEQYLAYTHDLRVLDPVDLDLIERTATAETVNEDGERVTVTIAWIDTDTKAAFLGENFDPLTVELTTH